VFGRDTGIQMKGLASQSACFLDQPIHQLLAVTRAPSVGQVARTLRTSPTAGVG
jgi:hypothetical protein